MLPELFSIGPFTVHSYGLFIAIGVILAIFIGDEKGKKAGLSEGVIFNIGVWGLVGGVIGSKILHWITIFPEILENPKLMLDFSGGYVVYGGLIGGVLAAIIYCRVKKYNFLVCSDIAAPMVALAQGFGRIGCFMTGCCYGQETSCAIGVTFTKSLFAPNSISLFPIQLVASGLNFLNFIVLSWIYKNRKTVDGSVAALYIIFYSVGRFILEFFRGDIERGSVGSLSTSQFISIFTVIAGIIMYIWVKRKGTVEKK